MCSKIPLIWLSPFLPSHCSVLYCTHIRVYIWWKKPKTRQATTIFDHPNNCLHWLPPPNIHCVSRMQAKISNPLSGKQTNTTCDPTFYTLRVLNRMIHSPIIKMWFLFLQLNPRPEIWDGKPASIRLPPRRGRSIRSSASFWPRSFNSWEELSSNHSGSKTQTHSDFVVQPFLKWKFAEKHRETQNINGEKYSKICVCVCAVFPRNGISENCPPLI